MQKFRLAPVPPVVSALPVCAWHSPSSPAHPVKDEPFTGRSLAAGKKRPGIPQEQLWAAVRLLWEQRGLGLLLWSAPGALTSHLCPARRTSAPDCWQPCQGFPSPQQHQTLIAGWQPRHVKKAMAQVQATVFFFLWDDQRALNKGTEKVSQTSLCSDCTEGADNGRSTAKSVKVRKDWQGMRPSQLTEKQASELGKSDLVMGN